MTPPIRTTLRYDERAALDGATSAYQWDALVRRLVRVRNGEMPADWQALVVDSGMFARVSAHWPAPVCFPTRLPACIAYRSRGPIVSGDCNFGHDSDRLPEVTACFDPRVWAAIVRNPTAGVCADATAGCA
jgi:hypothetical protein